MDEKDKSILKSELIEASTSGDFKKVKLLFNQGADLHPEALFAASYRGHLEVVEYLISNDPNLLSFHEAIKTKFFEQFIGHCRAGNIKEVEVLIKKGVDIHRGDDQALLNASLAGNLEIVKFLVEHGADIHAQDDRVLNYGLGNVEIVKYLVSKGMDVHTKNDNALMLAACDGYLETIKYLIIKHRCDPELALKHAKVLNRDEVVDWCKNYIKVKNFNDRLEIDLIKKTDKINKKIKI